MSLSLKLQQDQHVFFSATYASTAYVTRRELWSELQALQQAYVGPWCYIGDFNVVLGAHEKRGGNLPLQISCDDFRNWTE